jgi:hypothetical protein
MEDKTSELQKSLQKLEMAGDPDFMVMNVQFVLTLIQAMHFMDYLSEKFKPDVVIIDPLFDFLSAKDISDYAAATNLMRPFKAFARETGIAVVFSHHNRKGGFGSAADQLLGSISLFGGVDTLITVSDEGAKRFVESEQRYGVPLEKTEMVLRDDGSLDLGDVWERPSKTDLRDRALDVIRENPGIEFDDLQAELHVGDKALRGALKALLGAGTVVRTGNGRRGNAYAFTAS